ncbi:hypothetical protein PHLGIDRAFT_252670 [Phlebiopsis gigantea 11061_1 CR5-6]|uniref:Uncharacterized protein n=1 Tax=Phlebiopsis gigantea (strain 11061_1 CR5-6) TaxID=745531 RepID=A0A0C3NEU7_PHLG1|nr:hypothetical protein PHLGIDRAFT_252670 [Phlebiopsis gigantea 11061_1 CR5-6]
MPQRHVRDLTITADGPTPKKEPVVTMQELLKLLLQIPALQVLNLHGLALEYDHETLTPRRQPLERLALKFVCGIGTREGLISALLSICSPRALCLTQLSFDTTNPQVTWPIPHISGITTLTLRARWSVAQFLEIFKQGAVQDLRVSCYVTSDVQALGDFLAEAGHQLKRFSIDLTDFIMRTPNPLEEDIRRLHLTHMTSLTELTLRFSFLAEPWSSLPFNASMLRLGSRLIASAPPALHTIAFSVQLDGQAATEDEYLRPFGQRLDADLQWLNSVDKERPALRRVVWKWRGMGRQSKWSLEQRVQLKRSLAGLLRGQFASLDKGDLLVLQKSDDEP